MSDSCSSSLRLVRLLGAGLVTLLLAGCQLWGPPGDRGRPLAPPFGEFREIERDVEIRVAERIHGAHCRLSLKPESTHIVFTDERGELMVEMRYQRGRLEIRRTPRLPPAVSADDLIADLQLALWPLARLRAGLTPGWTLAADNERRVLRFNGVTEARVDYQSDVPSSRPLPVYNARHDYLLILSPADPGV